MCPNYINWTHFLFQKEHGRHSDMLRKNCSQFSLQISLLYPKSMTFICTKRLFYPPVAIKGSFVQQPDEVGRFTRIWTWRTIIMVTFARLQDACTCGDRFAICPTGGLAVEKHTTRRMGFKKFRQDGANGTRSTCYRDHGQPEEWKVRTHLMSRTSGQK